MYTNNREAYRQAFANAWQKHLQRTLLDPQEAEIIQVILLHPEYQLFLEKPDDVKDQEFSLEENPFLHMSLHLAIREQVRMNRPFGIAAIFQALNLIGKFNDTHEVEHEMMNCLASMLWQAQEKGVMPDEKTYLAELKQLQNKHSS